MPVTISLLAWLIKAALLPSADETESGEIDPRYIYMRPCDRMNVPEQLGIHTYIKCEISGFFTFRLVLSWGLW